MFIQIVRQTGLDPEERGGNGDSTKPCRLGNLARGDKTKIVQRFGVLSVHRLKHRGGAPRMVKNRYGVEKERGRRCDRKLGASQPGDDRFSE